MQVWKETDSHWYGNYLLNSDTPHVKMVHVALHEDDPDVFRISVWGDDDMGKEKEYKTKDEALVDFHHILAQNRVNIGFLVDMGFINA